MSLFERAHERRISVAFPNQQAQRFLFWTAGDTREREQKGGRETQASFHFSPCTESALTRRTKRRMAAIVATKPENNGR
jgi:hypothetical protein